MQRLRLALATGLAGTLVASLGLLASSGPVGLEMRVFADPASRQRPSITETAAEPSSQAVERLSDALATPDLRIVWDGFLYVPSDGARQMAVAAAGRARLWIDGRLVAEKEPTRESVDAVGTLDLGAGPHLFSLEYERAGGPPDLQVRWADDRTAHRLSLVPAMFLSPRASSDRQWRLRTQTPVLIASLLFSWLALLVWLAGRLFRWGVGDWDALRSSGFRTVSVFCAGLFVAGIWWGWPGPGWALDALDPGTVIEGWSEGFSGGWFGRYPPVHYYTLAISYLPVLAAARLELVSPFAEPVYALLQLQGRFVSVVFSLGTLAAVGLVADRLLGRAFVALSALCAAVFLPLVYYAKTANVDAAYVFWFALSMVFLADAHRRGHLRDFVGFGIAAAIAIATKDQAYGLYVLPAVHLVYAARRRPGRLLAGAAAGLVAFAASHNLPLNAAGFAAHVRTLMGPTSVDFRMFENTVGGQAALLAATSTQVVVALGWSGTIAVTAGLFAGVRQHTRRLPVWLLLATVSYYVTLLALIGYSYDRFLLPITVMAALPAAAGLGWLFDTRSRWRLGPVAAVVLLAWMCLRAVSVDYLMIRDSRYALEAWLEAAVPAGASVASLAPSEYLPRLEPYRQIDVRPGVFETLQARPDFIVLNLEHMARDLDDPLQRQWFEWLESGEGPYQRMFRTKTPLGWLPLGRDRRFTDAIDDPYTNLDKINPAVAVYARRDGG